MLRSTPLPLLSAAQSLHGFMSKLAKEDELKMSGLFIFLAVWHVES